jgi:hypothetical protein
MYGQIYPPLRADVQPHVPVVGAYFTKIGYQLHSDIKGVSKIILRIRLCLAISKDDKKTTNEKKTSQDHRP